MTLVNGKLTCDWHQLCHADVTHIGSKGYVYCQAGAEVRRQFGVEQTRKMRRWEIELLEAGGVLPSYRPGPKPSDA